MRYMCMHKADAACEAGLPPRPQVMAGMGPLLQSMAQAGVLVAAEGLQPSSGAVRLRFVAGKRSMTDGPFTESKELIAGFSLVQVESLQQAIAWSTHFGELMQDAEIDIRGVQEPAPRDA